jgi:hypothetical protein
MTIHFDEKGKFYTDVISKNPVPSTIQTSNHKIEGNVYQRDGWRLIDELQSSGQFIAVTDATVFDLNGEIIYQTGFMTINRDHIHWIVPHDNSSKNESTKGGQL